MITAILLGLLQAASPPAAQRPLPPLHGGPGPMTCPVGGETFSAWQPGSYSTFGQRPDGKPYSYLPMPFPLPECPTNKLVVFDRFSPAEIERLPAILAAPDYRRLIGTETPYYRAAWLSTRLGRPPEQALNLLLTATWDGKGGPMAARATPASLAQARRYQEEFVARVAALPAASQPAWALARAANAERELGRFGPAEALRRRAVTQMNAKDRENGWPTFLDRLAAVIARQDVGAEPLDLIPPQQVAFACADDDRPQTAFDRDRCATPEIVAKVTEIRARRAAAAKKTPM